MNHMNVPGSQSRGGGGLRLPLFMLLAFVLFAACLFAQAPHSILQSPDLPVFGHGAAAYGAQGAPETSPPHPAGASSAAAKKNPSSQEPGKDPAPDANQQQPQRILGIMPNFRAVSAGSTPPPPTPRESFLVATQNSFDYSSFLFVGITSALAEGTNTHPQLGKGMPGFARYYWRGFVDKTDGNYLVIFALPCVFHQDERYFALGRGSFLKRLVYAGSRVVITPDYHGHPSFNASELLGRGMAQGISMAYYPSQTRTWGGMASKYGYAIGRDALTNIFREFWPDIATHILHRHP